MIVKQLGRKCECCGDRFVKKTKYQRICEGCHEKKIRKFATIKIGMKIDVLGARK